jgi:ATP-binding cassette subfamily F protein uup
MIEWLEAYFAKEKLPYLFITHDRFFLERVCNEIIELDNGKIIFYKGNYFFYQEKEERIASENSSVDKAQNLFVKELEWMRRQPKERLNRNRVRMIYDIKEKAQSRRRKTRWNLKSTWSVWEARLSSTKSKKLRIM